MKHPEDVLQEIAPAHGLTVEIDSRPDGFTLIKLLTGAGIPVIVVREPPHGWPVHVDHYHADQSTTTHAWCGPGHNPNRARLLEHPEARFTAAEWDELESQKEHSPIDTPEKLLELCTQLMGHEQTHLVIARSQRVVQREARLRRS